MTPGSVRMLLVAALCTLTGCKQPEVPEKSITPVKIQAVEMESLATETRYSANITPNSQVPVSFRAAGYVDKLLQVQGRDVQEGDIVEKGTVLATMRQVDFLTKLNQARAQLQQAQASLQVATSQQAEAQASAEQAGLDFTRAKNLFATQSLTKPDYDAAKARTDGAQAKLQGAENQLNSIRAQIEAAQQSVQEAELSQQDSLLKAPISGVILKRNIETGSLAAPATAAFQMADTVSVKAVLGVPDTVVSSMHIGAPLPAEADAVPGRTFPGRITAISPAADARSRVFDVEVTIDNRANLLKSGMIATVIIPGAGGAREALVVPLSAVVRSNKNPDQYAVFVVEQSGGKPVARMQDVRLGKTLSHGVIVTSGVTSGQQVIISGSTLVSDGETVQVVP